MSLTRCNKNRKAYDEGFGLPELLVSMAVFGVVAAAMSAVFVNTIDTVRFVSTNTATTADARIAMEAMTRSLRVAIAPSGVQSAIVEADEDHIVFYSSLNRGTSQTDSKATRVTYVYDSSTRCLAERQDRAVSNPDSSERATVPYVWPSAGTTKCLIRTNAPPRFDYFDDGRIVGGDGVTTVAPLTLPGGGWDADENSDLAALKSVISIQMSINVQDPDAVDVNGMLVTDRVTLVNVLTARDLESD
jgi:prepilin-type N-terminal cleavage/methylation domain-containing protein